MRYENDILQSIANEEGRMVLMGDTFNSFSIRGYPGNGTYVGQQNGGSYVASEGNITPSEFADIYPGDTESQIMVGNSSFLGYKYHNDMRESNIRFVMLKNGKEVEMIRQYIIF